MWICNGICRRGLGSVVRGIALGWLLWGSSGSLGVAADAPDASGGEITQISLSPGLRQRCLQILREGLRSDDQFWPSMHAAEALTLAGEGDEVRAALEPMLSTERDDQRRCGVARELVRAGDRSKAAIMLDILAGDDPHGHVHACESLYKVGEIGDGALLRQALEKSKNPNQRLMAAGALGRCGSPRALRFLREKLTSSKAEVSRIAAWLLGRIGDRSDILELRRQLQKATDPLIRCYFEHALAALGDPEGLKALAGNLSHENSAVRTYAATFAGDARAVTLKDQIVELLDDSDLDVRVRAAQSLIVLSQPVTSGQSDDIACNVFVATKDNPRYSEGSIIVLRDGSLLYATTEFVGGGSDFSQARIIACSSNDGGQNWSPPRVLQENIGERNVMSATLCRLARPLRENTPIGLFYLVKNGADDLKVYLRISEDEGQTFGDPILVTDSPGYHVMNNDRVQLLSTGRLLAPVATTRDVRKENHFTAHCYWSDDGGKTWQVGQDRVDLPKRGAMEPEVFEMRDGRVGMIMRSQLGYIAICYSDDGGETWSEPVNWEVKAPEAPATLRRIPATGDLLLVWNHAYTPGAGHGGKRTPLTAAVSTDEGRTWKLVRQIETRSDQTYAYTSLTFYRGRALLSYYVRDEQSGRISSRFRAVPVSWFYEADQERPEPESSRSGIFTR